MTRKQELLYYASMLGEAAVLRNRLGLGYAFDHIRKLGLSRKVAAIGGAYFRTAAKSLGLLMKDVDVKSADKVPKLVDLMLLTLQYMEEDLDEYREYC